MVQHFLQGQSLTRILPEESGDQVLGLSAHMSRIEHLDLRDSLVSFIVGLGFEWRFSHQKLVGENSETPEINLEIK